VGTRGRGASLTSRRWLAARAEKSAVGSCLRNPDHDWHATCLSSQTRTHLGVFGRRSKGGAVNPDTFTSQSDSKITTTHLPVGRSLKRRRPGAALLHRVFNVVGETQDGRRRAVRHPAGSRRRLAGDGLALQTGSTGRTPGGGSGAGHCAIPPARGGGLLGRGSRSNQEAPGASLVAEAAPATVSSRRLAPAACWGQACDPNRKHRAQASWP
jgi:hypothetical protein